MFKDYGTVIIFALFLLICCDRTSSECMQLSACSCVFQDGYGYDLSNLTSLGLLNATGYNSTVYFEPCKNIKMNLGNTTTKNECALGNGVSLCANVTGRNEFFSLGTVEEAKLLAQMDPSKSPTLTFRHGEFISTVQLLCCNQCNTHFTIDKHPGKDRYNLILMSPSACKVLLHPKGLSTGSILVILLFVFSGLYFIGGALVLKLTRGATGWEMLPNHEFWCGLPSLVRDGIVFTFNCCRVDSYERI